MCLRNWSLDPKNKTKQLYHGDVKGKNTGREIKTQKQTKTQTDKVIIKECGQKINKEKNEHDGDENTGQKLLRGYEKK